MAIRIANSVLDASTLDILNVIRQNASLEYQQSVPVVTKATDIPKVGEIIMGTPANKNQFLNALVNRIALVRAKSATFNNPYSALKKGYLEFGETVEEIFANIVRAYDYSAEKAEKREFKRYLPDVQTAFHIMNWRTFYPVTIQDQDLKRAFLSMDGVQNLIAKIVDTIYTGADYDEFLLFKYLIIKGVTKGGFVPKSIGDGTDLRDSAVQFRAMSNKLPFMSTLYNERRVLNTTPKNRQVIFMDAEFNAQFDVNVLASAFNMDKADFMGRLHLIDSFKEFDNARFEFIRSQCDGIEEVTAEELALMEDVKAVLLDEEWFQVYDNEAQFTEKYVASGLYWNYFYHTWKTISYSPFANAVVFVSSTANIELPESVTFTVTDKLVTKEGATIITFELKDDSGIDNKAYSFVQTDDATNKGIAVQKYGVYIFPTNVTLTTPELIFNDAEFETETGIDTETIEVGDEFVFTPVED